MNTELLAALKSLSNDLCEFTRKIIQTAQFNKTYLATILSTDGKGNYKVQICRKEYSATSYFNLSVHSRAYAVAPNNNFNKLFLIPFKQ